MKPFGRARSGCVSDGTEIHAHRGRAGKAQDLGLDLVLIAPTAVPPVAKAVDYGHYQYELKKKQHEPEEAACGRSRS